MANLEDCDMIHTYHSDNYKKDDVDDFVAMIYGALTAFKCNIIEQPTLVENALWKDH